MRSPLSLVLFAAITFPLAACYRYAPLAAQPAPGVEVRLRLSEQGAAQLSSRLGPGASVITGRVIARDDAGITVAVSEILRGAERFTWAGEQVEIPNAAVSGSELRSVDRRRTLLVAAAGVAGAILLTVIVRAIGSGAGGGDDVGGVILPP